jgi:hypothetical protein
MAVQFPIEWRERAQKREMRPRMPAGACLAREHSGARREVKPRSREARELRLARSFVFAGQGRYHRGGGEAGSA